MIRASFDPITNRQSFVDEVEILDADTGEMVDLTDSEIKVAIRLPCLPTMPTDYGWLSHYAGSGASPVASTDDGTIVIPDVGVFVFTFPRAQIASLCPGFYVVGCTMTRYDETIEPILGVLTILDGVVPL